MTDRADAGFAAEAHEQGLLTFADVADRVGLRYVDVLDLMRDGAIESVRVDNKPCATPEAVEAFLAAQPG